MSTDIDVIAQRCPGRPTTLNATKEFFSYVELIALVQNTTGVGCAAYELESVLGGGTTSQPAGILSARECGNAESGSATRTTEKNKRRVSINPTEGVRSAVESDDGR